MKNTIVLAFLLVSAVSPGLQAQQQVIPLWPGAAPGSENWTQKEVQYLNDQKQKMIRNVVIPTLTVYKPDPAKANGTAVIVAPGGGFLFLSWQTEGTEVAEWLASKGITAFLLKYRLNNSGETQEEFQKAMMALFKAISAANNPQNAGKPEGDISHHEAMSAITMLGREDGRQAIRIVRKHAAEWGINPAKIGIMGFSAGGMVTLGPVLQHDQESRPDFAAPVYTPWSDTPVPADAPPLFILVAGDDQLAAQGSIAMYTAWKNARKEAELHVYAKGGHGFGMQKKGLPVDSWIERFWEWMKAQGF
ncbi:MAG: alpha/beta hydrolase [Bacteroidales bacterium]|nr:alpha/beta hydrolase [Bacteroidales bacterium]